MHVSKVRTLRVLVVAVIGALTLAACGSSSNESSSGGPVARIGVIVPLSGDLAAVGNGIKNSVDLAIKQANNKKTVAGWTLEIDAQDDQAKPDVGAAAATKLASDAKVVGVVGTYNSSVALQVAPILDAAHIVQVSPANTNDKLTRGENFKTAPSRPHANYFRTATYDDLQGGFAADYAYKTAGAKTAVLIHDKKAYGQGLTESFKAKFEADGGQILGETQTVNPGDKDFSGVVTKIKPLNPQMIFYGGEYPEASLLSSQAKLAGITVPVMGGDGIVNKTYVDVAGPSAAGDLGTSVGAPSDQLPSAQTFLTDYAAGGYKDPAAAYGALAFDAANTIINALAKVLPGKTKVDSSVREQVIVAVQATDFEGVSGKVSFDQYGDTTTKLLTVYKVEGNDWKPVLTQAAT
jgi:branched-chain amino acid transport system substrate-binding protein